MNGTGCEGRGSRHGGLPNRRKIFAGSESGNADSLVGGQLESRKVFGEECRLLSLCNQSIDAGSAHSEFLLEPF